MLRDWRFLLKKTLTLFSAGIPFSFAHFPALGIHERVLSTAYFALAYLPLLPFAAGKMFQTLKTGKDPDRIFPLLLFPLVFTAFFIFSPFDIAYDIGYAGFRYLSPLHLFLLPLPALLLPAGKLKKILTPAVLILGLLGQTSLFFKEPFARAQSYNANSYYQMGTTLRFLLWPKLKTIEDVQKELKKYEPAERVYFLWGMVDAAMSDGDKALLAGSSIYADEVSAAFTGPSYSFLDEWKKSLLPDSENFMIRKINPANFRASWDSNILIGRSFQNLLDNASPQNRPALFREIGWIANAMYREDRKRALNVLLENVPADGKEEALRGFLAFDENYGINRN